MFEDSVLYVSMVFTEIVLALLVWLTVLALLTTLALLPKVLIVLVVLWLQILSAL